MVYALGGGDGKCSSVRGAASLLLTAPRLGVRALDREAGPVEAGRLAGDSAAARSGGRLPGAWETNAGRIPDWALRCRSAPPRDSHVPGGAIRHIAVKIVREIREQFGSAAGNREVMTENAPAFAQWRPASLSTCSCDPGRAIVCLLRLPLRPLQWP
jgi:hypothetical protein